MCSAGCRCGGGPEHCAARCRCLMWSCTLCTAVGGGRLPCFLMLSAIHDCVQTRFLRWPLKQQGCHVSDALFQGPANSDQACNGRMRHLQNTVVTGVNDDATDWHIADQARSASCQNQILTSMLTWLRVTNRSGSDTPDVLHNLSKAPSREALPLAACEWPKLLGSFPF